MGKSHSGVAAGDGGGVCAWNFAMDFLAATRWRLSIGANRDFYGQRSVRADRVSLRAVDEVAQRHRLRTRWAAVGGIDADV